MSALPLRQLPEFFATAKRFNSKFFRVNWYPNQVNEFRFTVVVPKTVNKLAVVRNRMKRRSREAIQANLTNFPQIDAVFFPSYKVKEVKFAELIQDAAFIAQKLSQLQQ